jgi:choline kinase
VRSVTTATVRTAVILAAGNGDRFANRTKDSKLLEPLLGQPLLLRTLASAHDAGIDSAVVVLGYQADRVRSLVERGGPPELSISFAYNPAWRLENGVSVGAARLFVDRQRFALLMGDHIFDPRVLRRLLNVPIADGESVLAVDGRPSPPEVAVEATKVLREGARIIAIGKDLSEYDALDTGMFVCSSSIFDALDAAQALGDTTLSGGIRELARRGMMRAHDIGEARWCDIDTVSDLEAAESALAETAEPA